VKAGATVAVLYHGILVRLRQLNVTINLSHGRWRCEL